MRGRDAVEQARAWLVEHAGQAPGSDAVEEAAADHGPKHDLIRGRSHDPEEDPDADHEAVARTIALRKLTAQARTRRELDQALQKKNVPDEVAASVLDRLEEVGLVDDEAFAQDWVASRQQRRHLSRSALRRELQGKGVNRDLVDCALASIDTDDELAAARTLAAKKSMAMGGLEPPVRRRRLAGVLARRGFGGGIISMVLSELAVDEADDPGA
jgi:regulatory protein